MARTFTALAVVLVCWTISPAAPVPKGQNAWADFIPIAIGNKWVYDGVFDEVSEEVVEREMSSGEVRWTVRRTTSLSTEERSYVATKGGVVERGSRGERRLLRFPLVEAESWEFEPLASGDRSSASTNNATCGGWVEVQTPAGVYKAVAVSTATTTRWYVPGVGMVMVENGGGRKQMLKSFTPGKGEKK